MTSINAQNVAKDVSENIRKGKRVVMGKILKDNGYSDSVSKHPDLVTTTLSYQEEIKPVADGMIRMRDKAIKEMHNKDLSKEKLDTLSNVVRNLTHDILLVKGKATSIISVNDMRNLSDDELRQITSGKGVSAEGVSEA